MHRECGAFGSDRAQTARRNFIWCFNCALAAATTAQTAVGHIELALETVRDGAYTATARQLQSELTKVEKYLIS